MCNLYFPVAVNNKLGADKVEVEKEIARWLRNGCDRNGARKKRTQEEN